LHWARNYLVSEGMNKMAKYLYPHRVSLNVYPKADTLYAFRFSYKTTEPLSEVSVERVFSLITADFQEKWHPKYMALVRGEKLLAELDFKLPEPSDATLSEIWENTKDFAHDRYIDLTLVESVVYEPSLLNKLFWAVLLGLVSYVVLKKPAPKKREIKKVGLP